MKNKILVIGGGPAGMMAAIRAAQLGGDVILFEKNPSLGRKLLLTGKGRCNITNACSLDEFLPRFSGNAQFLRDSFSKFFNTQLIEFFETHGLKLKTERQQRVFPETDNAKSVLDLLHDKLRSLKVEIMFDVNVTNIVVNDKRISSVKLSNNRIIDCDKIIFATGGFTYKTTGSDGRALDLIKKLGHTIVPLRPGLVPLRTRQKFPQKLSGLTLKNIRLLISNGKKKIVTPIGELLFAGFGITGPLILSNSGIMVDWLNEGKDVFVEIDLKPELSADMLNARLTREFSTYAKMTIKNVLKHLLPKSLIDVFLDLSSIPEDLKVSHITQKQKAALIDLFKNLHFDIKDYHSLDHAMVTKGGVSLKEIDPKTMKSRIIDNLYFAGEMIDIDADTGGFNLQAAFSTGYLAGESAVKK